MRYRTIPEACKELRHGGMLVVVKSAGHGPQGVLLTAAEHVTPEALNFMATFGRGITYLALTADRAEQLGLAVLPADPPRPGSPQPTISMDARTVVSGGISAYDRALTIRLAATPAAGTQDFVRPGHVFPLRARPGGLLERAGLTEAAVELTRLSGLQPVGVFCNIIGDDGTVADWPALEVFATRHSLPICTVTDLLRHVVESPHPFLQRLSKAPLPTRFGRFQLFSYGATGAPDGPWSHLAVVRGEWRPETPVLVYLHPGCAAGDLLAATSCGCRGRLLAALRRIGKEKAGMVIYIAAGAAHAAPDAGPAQGWTRDNRNAAIAAALLRDQGVRHIKLLGGTTVLVSALADYGLEIIHHEPLRSLSVRPLN